MAVNIKKISGVLTDSISKITNLNNVQYDSYTKLLIHFDGTDTATSYIAETGQTLTFNGSSQLDTGQQKFGASSLMLDGNSDYITVPTSTDWAFGTGAFTVDFQFRIRTGSRDQTLYSHGGSNQSEGTGGTLFVGPDNKPGYYCSGLRIVSSTALSVDTWYHCAFIGNGGANGSRNIKMYINGTQIGSTYTFNYNFSQEVPYFSANEDYTPNCLDGWIDEVRISKGIQRWTSNFTSPTSAYLNRLVKKVSGVSNV